MDSIASLDIAEIKIKTLIKNKFSSLADSSVNKCGFMDTYIADTGSAI